MDYFKKTYAEALAANATESSPGDAQRRQAAANLVSPAVGNRSDRSSKSSASSKKKTNDARVKSMTQRSPTGTKGVFAQEYRMYDRYDSIDSKTTVSPAGARRLPV